MAQDTPFDALRSRLQRTGACALLETTTAASRALGWRRGRALLAEDPSDVLVADGTSRPFELLRSFARGLPSEGAVVGALAYDAARPRTALPGEPRLVALAV